MTSMKQVWNEKADQLKADLTEKYKRTGRLNAHRVDQYHLMKEAAKNCS